MSRIGVELQVISNGSEDTYATLLLTTYRISEYGNNVTILHRGLFNASESLQRLIAEDAIKLKTLNDVYITNFSNPSCFLGIAGLIYSSSTLGNKDLHFYGSDFCSKYITSLSHHVKRQWPILHCHDIGIISEEEKRKVGECELTFINDRPYTRIICLNIKAPNSCSCFSDSKNELKVMDSFSAAYIIITHKEYKPTNQNPNTIFNTTLIIDCQSLYQLYLLSNECHLKKYTFDFVYHLSSAEMFAKAEYADWLSSFGIETKHVLVDSNHQASVFRSANDSISTMHFAAASVFPLPSIFTFPREQYEREINEILLNYDRDVVYANNLMILQLLPLESPAFGKFEKDLTKEFPSLDYYEDKLLKKLLSKDLDEEEEEEKDDERDEDKNDEERTITWNCDPLKKNLSLNVFSSDEGLFHIYHNLSSDSDSNNDCIVGASNILNYLTALFYKETNMKKKAKLKEILDQALLRRFLFGCSNSLEDKILEGDETFGEIVFLGTGCAAPSKHRGSSAIYIRLQGGGVLLDAGEGAFSGLCRRYGVQGALNVVRKLKFVWISHKHPDHQVGLLRILFIHSKHCDASIPPLLVIAPPAVLNHLHDCGVTMISSPSHPVVYNHSEGLTHLQCRAVSCEDFNNIHHPFRMWLHASSFLNYVFSVRVHHCHDAFGLVIILYNGCKIVFSGDTIPCPSLVNVGKGANFLIHEATYDDSMESIAASKKHSTIGQALTIGKNMEAHVIILTHFSARYPTLPNVQRELESKLILTCDGMTVSLNPSIPLPTTQFLLNVMESVFKRGEKEENVNLQI